MELLKIPDHPGHNAAYQFGFIQAIKIQLQRMYDEVSSEPDPATGGHYVVALSILMNHANGLPTIAECGKFRMDLTAVPDAKIVFDWKEGKRNELLNHLNQ